MAGPAGAVDPALEQARAAQIPAHARMAPWFRYAVAPGTGPPPPPAPAGTAAASAACPGEGPAQAGSNGTATGGAEHGMRPKPVPPALTPAECEAGRLKGLRLKAERKAIRQQLRTGQMTLAEVLARDDQAADGMRVMAALKALPGVGGATAPKLLRETGIDGGHLIRGLTAGQRERLAATVAAVNSEPAGDRAAAAGLPPGNVKTTPPENAGDERSQIARDRGLRVSREDIQAALLEQAAREKPLSHNAIARRLGIQQGNRAVDRACADLVANSSLTNCPHRFTESGREAPGRKPAAHAKPAVRHGHRVTIPASGLRRGRLVIRPARTGHVKWPWRTAGSSAPRGHNRTAPSAPGHAPEAWPGAGGGRAPVP